MDEMENLKFTCPECGGHCLVVIEKAHLYTALVDIGTDSGSYDLGERMKEDIDDTIVGYCCFACGYEPKDKNGNPIRECNKIPQWVKDNCPQD